MLSKPPEIPLFETTWSHTKKLSALRVTNNHVKQSHQLLNCCDFLALLFLKSISIIKVNTLPNLHLLDIAVLSVKIETSV